MTGGPNKSFYDFKLPLENGQYLSLEHFKNKSVLVVNVNNTCELAEQIDELRNLSYHFCDHPFQVLALPCSQFSPLNQQKQTLQHEISLQVDPNWPPFANVKVNGPFALPLFNFLKDNARGLKGARAIKWNFTKFLVNCEGNVVKRYAPRTRPSALFDVIEKTIA